jgi:hypothetical protein
MTKFRFNYEGAEVNATMDDDSKLLLQPLSEGLEEHVRRLREHPSTYNYYPTADDEAKELARQLGGTLTAYVAPEGTPPEGDVVY